MIGLFAVVDPREPDVSHTGASIATGMQTRASWETTLFTAPGVVAARVGPSRNGSSWVSGDQRYFALLDGFAYTLDPSGPGKDRPATAEDLATALMHTGPQGLHGFQGEFFLLFYDRKQSRLVAASDRFGTRTTYTFQSGQRTIICSEPALFLRSGLIPACLNKQALRFILQFNKCRTGQQTLFENLEVFPPGSVATLSPRNGAGLTFDTYYVHTFEDRPDSPEVWVEKITPTLQHALETALADATPTCALALSGGLDSRLLLAGLPQDQREGLQAISFGIPESSEVQIAETVAKTAHCSYENIPLGPQDFLDHAELSVRRNEEFDIFVQGASTCLHRRAAEKASALMTGWDVDVPLRGTYLNPDLLRLEGNEQLIDLIKRKWTLFAPDELETLLLPTEARNLAEQTDQHLRGTCRSLAQRRHRHPNVPPIHHGLRKAAAVDAAQPNDSLRA